MLSSAQRRLLTLCAIRVDRHSVDWSLLARLALLDRGLDLLYAGHINESSAVARASQDVLLRGLEDLDVAESRVDDELALAERVGASLVTVLDSTYPANLRLVPNLPPFLFFRGELRSDDALSVAVVGTRRASEVGLARAASLSRRLVQHGVTVISGLAAGIDTAAHTAALEAGGRTIAVLGTGITKCYPVTNRALAERVVEDGALVSQFWPSTSPATWTFPRRNVVTSGISQGSVVIEASSTSGAKMQARLASEHGKRVFVVRSLVTDQEWARRYVEQGRAIEVGDVDDVVRHLAPVERVHRASEQRTQLALELL
jgi:DNA processing protein